MRTLEMSADDLHRPLFVPDLLANVLNQGSSQPLLHLLDGPTIAAGYTPQPLVAPRVEPTDIMRLGYSGGTTGKPKSLTTTQRVSIATLQLMMSEWEWPSPPRVLSCAPLSHAGAAMALPTLLKG